MVKINLFYFVMVIIKLISITKSRNSLSTSLNNHTVDKSVENSEYEKKEP